MSKPKRKIKLNYSKYSDSMILEQLNKIPNNELISRLETMNKTSLEKVDKLNILFPHLDDPDFARYSGNPNERYGRNGLDRILYQQFELI